MTSDGITLDTNVFEHFFRTEVGGMNEDGHVSDLFGKIISQKRTTYYDEGGRMANEMSDRLRTLEGHREQGVFLNMMRGFGMLPRRTIKVDHGSGLLNCIDQCVPGSTEQSDKVIIYVACRSDTLLVSNNHRHITNHATCLKQCAHRHASTSPEFWNSRTANANL